MNFYGDYNYNSELVYIKVGPCLMTTGLLELDHINEEVWQRKNRLTANSYFPKKLNLQNAKKQ